MGFLCVCHILAGFFPVDRLSGFHIQWLWDLYDKIIPTQTS